MAHHNICCDGCGRNNFSGRRYKCLRCDNYDLCGNCYDSGIVTLSHQREHPMQLLLDRHLRELHFADERFDEMHLPNCYTCPYCGLAGHTAKKFIEHVVAEHKNSNTLVICPMCVVMPNIDIVLMPHLWRHLQQLHLHHANLLDPLGLLGPNITRRSTFHSVSLSRRMRRRYEYAVAAQLDAVDESRLHSYSSRTNIHAASNDTSEQLTDEDLASSQRSLPSFIGPMAESEFIERSSTDSLYAHNAADLSTHSIIPATSAAAAVAAAAAGDDDDNVEPHVTFADTLSMSSKSSTAPAADGETLNFVLPNLLEKLQAQPLSHETEVFRLKRALFVEQLLSSAVEHETLMLPGELAISKVAKEAEKLVHKKLLTVQTAAAVLSVPLQQQEQQQQQKNEGPPTKEMLKVTPTILEVNKHIEVEKEEGDLVASGEQLELKPITKKHGTLNTVKCNKLIRKYY